MNQIIACAVYVGAGLVVGWLASGAWRRRKGVSMDPDLAFALFLLCVFLFGIGFGGMLGGK